MKKHFTGIALFIFIVGISGFIVSLFNEIPKPEIFEVQNTVPRYVSKNKCSKKNRSYKISDTVEITQMVYQEPTEYIAASFLLAPEYNADEISLNLHFFVKDSDQTYFLTTENILLKTKTNLVSIKEDGRRDFLTGLDLDLLTNLDSRKNLYVIAELKPSEKSDGVLGEVKSIPAFDENKAFAVRVVKN